MQLLTKFCRKSESSQTFRGPNNLGGEFLSLGEKQYFAWDTTPQSTKWLDMLKIWGVASHREAASSISTFLTSAVTADLSAPGKFNLVHFVFCGPPHSYAV